MAAAPFAGRKAADILAENGVQQSECDIFREAIDAAFEHVLHAHYAGGLALLLVATGGREASRVLRPAQGDTPAYFVLQVTLSDQPSTGNQPHPMHQALRHATPIGSIERPTTNSSPLAMAMTEIMDEHDPNEAADHTPNSAGVLLQHASALTPRSLGSDGLHAFRTQQGGGNADSSTRHGSRGQLPIPGRQNPARNQGLGNNGRSGALSPTVRIPVGGAFIQALSHSLGYASWPPTPIVNVLAAVSPGVI